MHSTTTVLRTGGSRRPSVAGYTWRKRSSRTKTLAATQPGDADEPAVHATPATDAGLWAALVIDQSGRILHCDGAVRGLFGYHRGELENCHVSLLLPQLAGSDWIDGCRLAPQLRYRCRIGCVFTGKTRDGESFDSRLFVSGVGDASAPQLRLTVRRSCAGGRDD